MTNDIKVRVADDPISVDTDTVRTVPRVGDTVIADTDSALTPREAAYPPVHYIPIAGHVAFYPDRVHVTPKTSSPRRFGRKEGTDERATRPGAKQPNRKRVEAETTGPLQSPQSHRVSLPQPLDGCEGCLAAGQEFKFHNPSGSTKEKEIHDE
jgi:hypothetical protein